MPDKRKYISIAMASMNNPFTKALVDVGLLPANCKRYVIDSGDPTSVMKIYFDCYLDDRVLDDRCIKAIEEMSAAKRDDLA